jgi:hypothetical protein
MAITITDNQIVINDAENENDWAGGSATGYSGFQREGSNCMGDQVGNGYGDLYVTITSEDYRTRTIFGWSRSGNPHLEASDGFGIILGDGTNRRSYTVGGTDNWGHFASGWGGFRLDTASLPSAFRTLTGGAVTIATVEDVGYSMGYNSKANGNADNVFWDQLKYITNGSAALTFSGGTVGVPGNFADIVSGDIATTSGDAFGVLRELVGAKAYEIFFGCEWGAATGDTYFSDSDFQLFINGGGSGDAGMSAGNMDMSLLAGTGTNSFTLNNFVCVNTGTVANWDFSALFETFELSNGSFVDTGAITLPVTGGTSRFYNDISHVNCGQVNLSTCTSLRLSFVGTTDANGAVLANRSLNAYTLSSDGTGHGIYITTPGTYTYTNNTFTGFGATTSTDAVIYNNSGGAVTINVNSGDTPTYRNGTSATTTIVAGAVTVQVTAINAAGTGIDSARIHLRASDGTGPFPFEESVTISRLATLATVTHTGHGMSTNDKVMLRGITDKIEDNTVFLITVNTVNEYEYTTTNSGSTSYTGTITSTFVALDGLANASGVLSTSRVYSSNQPVTGKTAKSTIVPFLKQGILTGAISSTTGYDQSAVMTSDE